MCNGAPYPYGHHQYTEPTSLWKLTNCEQNDTYVRLDQATLVRVIYKSHGIFTTNMI